MSNSLFATHVKVKYVGDITKIQDEYTYKNWIFRKTDDWERMLPLKEAEECQKYPNSFYVFEPTSSGDFGAQLLELQEQVKKLWEQIDHLTAGEDAPPEPPKNRGGRPRKHPIIEENTG